ncbi:MAG: hypothetical protein JWM18_153 [Chloroflexi bacterium]|jgi:hypothetical protein|nr:hypothetical protein [Chloroflexota bacterium]
MRTRLDVDCRHRRVTVDARAWMADTPDPWDRRDAPLRQRRDAIAAAYGMHPFGIATLSADTLVWLAAVRWGPLDCVRICRVSEQTGGAVISAHGVRDAPEVLRPSAARS